MDTLADSVNFTDLAQRLMLAGITIAVGAVFIALANFVVSYLTRDTAQAHVRFLVTRLVRYSLYLLLFLIVLMLLGVDQNLILGTAGIASVGAGLAARGAISSVIAGFLLLAEAPFKVGDVVFHVWFSGRSFTATLKGAGQTTTKKI